MEQLEKETKWRLSTDDVAYNKAIDVLAKKNFKRRFTPNYIEAYSPKEYAEVYTNLSISERITHLME
mgnify:CR=1 FL=1